MDFVPIFILVPETTDFGLIFIPIANSNSVEFGLIFVPILNTIALDLITHYGFWPNFHPSTTHYGVSSNLQPNTIHYGLNSRKKLQVEQ